jgi:hypothetical protein
MMIRGHLLIALCLITTHLLAQEAKKKEWDVNDPPGEWNWKEAVFTVNEGTWMNLDVSPDGKTIAFDMLGDIYTMPITGGKAKAIAQVSPGKYSLVLVRMANASYLPRMRAAQTISG